MNLPDPIVVLAEGHEGLCAAAWLASQGRVVRVLCPGPLCATGAVEPLFAGEHGRLDPLLGPTRSTDARPALLWRDRLLTVPRRRRDVAALAEVGTVRFAGELWRADSRLPRDLHGWGERRFGPTAWSAVLRPLLEARLGGDPSALHRGLGPLLTCRSDGPWRSPVRGEQQTIDAWIETIRAAGGEVLDDVSVTAIEVEDGRVAGVMTDHGRDRAATLVSDFAVPRTVALLPPEPTTDAGPASLGYADLAHVEMVAGNDLPPVVVLAGRASRILSADRMWVEMSGSTLAAQSDEALGERARGAAAPAIGSIGTGAIVRVAQGVPRPAPDTEGIVFRWLRRLAALGVLPVGPRALYVPMLPRDVVDTTVAVLDGVPPVAARGGRLGLTPARPWMLVQ